MEEKERLQPFLQSGGVVQITPEIWRAAVDERAACTDVFGLAKALMGYVYRTSRYVAGVTDVHTSTERFFHAREGVCQDFSHLMLALCRSVQLPARYVSGYVYDSKRKELRGAHASHAWVEVWVPGHGWHGLDPTKLEKERRSALAQRISDIAAAQSKAVSLARPAKANLHSLVLQSSKLRATL
jgi:transglutaminase-like putative cysteine protease